MDKHKNLPTGPRPPKIITVVIEATKDSRNTYDVKGNLPRLKDILATSITYPVDHGFIPRTALDDGSPLDAMILAEHPTFPGCLVDSAPIGLLKLTINSIREDKILAIPTSDPAHKDTCDIKDVSAHIRNEIEEFFKAYKNPRKDKINIIGWVGAKDAERTIVHAMKMYDIKK